MVRHSSKKAKKGKVKKSKDLLLNTKIKELSDFEPMMLVSYGNDASKIMKNAEQFLKKGQASGATEAVEKAQNMHIRKQSIIRTQTKLNTSKIEATKFVDILLEETRGLGDVAPAVGVIAIDLLKTKKAKNAREAIKIAKENLFKQDKR